MNANQLLEHFHRIGDAPDAIPRLRRFILDLAVRGKLVPQDPRDEPAAELLKRIAKEKARGKRREQDIPEIDNPDGPADLPRNWSLIPLIALGSWAIGAGFPKNEQGLNDGPYFFLKVSDMNLPGNEKYITTSNNRIDDDAAARMRAKIHPLGTIIFPKIGGAIATNKRRILTKGSAIDNNCLGITFSKELDAEWAYLLLINLDFTQYQAGTAVPALQQGVLEQIVVGLPPLAEQHRIVAKVDELMTLCDRLEAARAGREAMRGRLAAASLAPLNAPDPDSAIFADHARFALVNLDALTTRPDQIKALRQTILNLAVRGKLVPQDPRDEPASELLKRIAAEKARLKAGETKKEQPLSPLGPEQEPFYLPKSWRWSRLRSLASTLGDGLHGTPTYSEGGDCYFINGNNLDNGKIVIKSNTKTVSFDEMKKYKKPLSDSVLVSINGTIGNVAFYNNEKIILGKSACYFNLTKLTYKIFVKAVLDSPYFANYALQGATGTTIMNLSLKAMNEFPVPLPPLAEQQRIVAKIDALMALCDRLEASLEAAAATRRLLLDALLAGALLPEEIQEQAA